MRLLSRWMAIATIWVLGLAAGPSLAGVPPCRTPQVPVPRIDERLLVETLRASGIEDPSEQAWYAAAFHRALDEIARQVGRPHSCYHQARRLHVVLHRGFLRRYDAAADGLDAILDRGEYNCLSASLFYGLTARAFGFDARVVEIPRHVFVRLQIDGRWIDIESTSRTGFDLRQKLDRSRPLNPTSWYGANEETRTSGASSVPGAGFDDLATSVDLEHALAFLWHNSGRRALERGEALRAAAHFLEEARLQPGLTSRSDAIYASLARAFRLEYEAGHFEAAYRIAATDLEIFPGSTSARDRLLAAALKRIDAESEAGDLRMAEKILDEAGATTRVPADLVRLERGACPLIVAAAVRVGDWDMASRMASRFAGAQPDQLESERLAVWVGRRRLEALAAAQEGSCAEPRLEGVFAGPAGSGFTDTGASPSGGSASAGFERPAGSRPVLSAADPEGDEGVPGPPK